MEHSDNMGKLGKALAAFQAEVKDPSRDGQNPHFRSKYVQIDGLLAAVRPMAAKHGLSIIQSTGGNGQDISVTTMILHDSGEWLLTDALSIRPSKQDPQGCMSAITYARRYSLSAALGVAWDDDDDGNAASEKEIKQDKPARSRKDEYIAAVAQAAKAQHLSGEDVKKIIKKRYGKASSASLTDIEAQDLERNFLQYAVELIDDEALMDGV